MQYYLEHLATCVAAVSGALAARGKQVDLFGVVVLALVTALGGGTLRDVILGVPTVFWVSDASFVLTAVVCALVVFFLARLHILSGNILLFADAGGLLEGMPATEVPDLFAYLMSRLEGAGKPAK